MEDEGKLLIFGISVLVVSFLAVSFVNFMGVEDKLGIFFLIFVSALFSSVVILFLLLVLMREFNLKIKEPIVLEEVCISSASIFSFIFVRDVGSSKEFGLSLFYLIVVFFVFYFFNKLVFPKILKTIF